MQWIFIIILAFCCSIILTVILLLCLPLILGL